MKLGLLLSSITFLFLAPSDLLAQQSISVEQVRIAGGFQLVVLTQDEFKHLSSQASEGDRESQYWLALLYMDGKKFVSKSSKSCIDWLSKSAEQGYAPAQQALEGLVNRKLFGTNRDSVKAEMYMLRGAEQGNADSQFWLGVAYEQNWFGTTDLKEAAKWYRKAAEQGQPDAQASLGMLYEDGDGVEQDYRAAALWYRKAAEHVPDLGGAGQGRWHLGQLYEDGLGVPEDYVQAYMWFSLSNGERHIADLRPKMTNAQILEAQRMIEQWKSGHPEPQSF